MSTAFESATAHLLDDGFALLRHSMKRSMGIESHYVYEGPRGRIYWHAFRAIQDFVYYHRDQDVNHGFYSFFKDEIYFFKNNYEYFMPDKSKLKYLGLVDDRHRKRLEEK